MQLSCNIVATLVNLIATWVATQLRHFPNSCDAISNLNENHDLSDFKSIEQLLIINQRWFVWPKCLNYTLNLSNKFELELELRLDSITL